MPAIREISRQACEVVKQLRRGAESFGWFPSIALAIFR
jgi:hypothetical protein